MTSPRPVRSVRTTVLAVLALLPVVLIGTASALPAWADDPVLADSSAIGAVVASGATSDARSGPQAAASVPRGIVVTNHRGEPVSLFARGRQPIRRSHPGAAAARFTGLQAGTAYTVVVGGRSLGAVVAVDRPAAVSRVLVNATSVPGSVAVRWTYRETARTGGSRVTFTVVASSPTAPSVEASTWKARRLTLTGLDPDSLYTFSVTVSNSAGRGRTTTAAMARTLAQLSGVQATATPAPAPTPSPTPTPTPTPTAVPAPAPPATRTIYVCPDLYVENSMGTCTRTIAYTYHQEQSGPAPILDSYTTSSPACPPGYNLEDYGWTMYCRLYGPPPMATVKDPTPEGFTDNGAAWVRTVPKQAVVVPA